MIFKRNPLIFKENPLTSKESFWILKGTPLSFKGNLLISYGNPLIFECSPSTSNNQPGSLPEPAQPKPEKKILAPLPPNLEKTKFLNTSCKHCYREFTLELKKFQNFFEMFLTTSCKHCYREFNLVFKIFVHSEF